MKPILRKTRSIKQDRERITKNELFIGIAELVAQRSTCSRKQVGAIITDRTNSNILDIGYNGNYAGGPNTCDIDGAGICGCVHAEINALVKNSSEPRGAIYVTDSPCMNCAKAIINSGIEKVYYRNDYRIADGLNLLKKVLKVEKIK